MSDTNVQTQTAKKSYAIRMAFDSIMTQLDKLNPDDANLVRKMCTLMWMHMRTTETLTK